jgi:hypothetical protein
MHRWILGTVSSLARLPVAKWAWLGWAILSMPLPSMPCHAGVHVHECDVMLTLNRDRKECDMMAAIVRVDRII